MFPTIFSLGPFTISSFGFFLTIAFLAAVFVMWKIARVYDVDEEAILDLSLLTFLGAIFGARVYFILTHLSLFDTPIKMILINRYPGLSFWGGGLAGILILCFFAFRLRLNFWQIADFASVGVSLGLVIGNIGCFLGGCGYGIESSLPIATPVVGVIGKRLPISLIEGLILTFVFTFLYRRVLKFHFSGLIASIFFVLVGLTKLITEYFRGDSKVFILWFGPGHLYSATLVLLGVAIFYFRSNRNIINDLKIIVTLPQSAKRRQELLLSIRKSWYNSKIEWKIRLGQALTSTVSTIKSMKRRLNVRTTPKNIS